MKTFFNQIQKIKFNPKILYFSILLLLFYSCEKPKDVTIDYVYTANEIIYYPEKHISILFDVKPKYDIGDYTITWYTPDTLTGEGPYQITITNNLVLDFEISDG